MLVEKSVKLTWLLDIVAVLMIFITGSHQLLITAVVDSYSLFHPGDDLFTGDMLSMASTLLNHSFAMGMRLAAPYPSMPRQTVAPARPSSCAVRTITS